MNYTKFDVQEGGIVEIKAVSFSEPIIVKIIEMEGSWFLSSKGRYAYSDILQIFKPETNPEYYL